MFVRKVQSRARCQINQGILLLHRKFGRNIFLRVLGTLCAFPGTTYTSLLMCHHCVLEQTIFGSPARFCCLHCPEIYWPVFLYSTLALNKRGFIFPELVFVHVSDNYIF